MRAQATICARDAGDLSRYRIDGQCSCRADELTLRRRHTVHHLLAFIVIGLVLGILASTAIVGGKAKSPIGAIIGGLVGGIVGGEILLQISGHAGGKYTSLVASIVLAVVLAWLGRGFGGRS